MKTSQNNTLSDLSEKIVQYGKENLDDILYVLGEAVQIITGQRRCRIYLEDLTRGQLVCSAVSGRYPALVRDKNFPLNADTFLVSRVYITQDEIQFEDLNRLEGDIAPVVAKSFSIRASLLLPILHRGRSLGVLCVDSSRPGRLPNEEQRQALHSFLAQVASTVNQARKYHQQMLLARQVDASKNREAALSMVKSAVKLVDNLALASVLVPSQSVGDETEGGLQILATYSQEKEARKLYEEEKMINLGPGTSLLSRYINRAGVIVDDRLLQPLFIQNLAERSLQKKVLTEELGLQSLYVVPFYEEHTRRVICLVNYYPRGDHLFNDFETGLLESHAEMAQQVIREIGLEHMEIQVLSDINDLLQEKFSGVQPFLSRILSKATELIGADTGSIAVVRERSGERWLVIEEDDSSLVGAKSKEWLKKDIPPLVIGGDELPSEQRSLSGFAAHSGRPMLIADTRLERGPDSFYKEITDAIRSEIALPVVSDGETIAVICLDSLRPYYFTEEHKRILMIIERLIARYLADLKQIERLTGEISRLGSDVGYRDPKISSYHLGNIIGNSHQELEVVNFIQRITPPIFNRIAFWSGQQLRETTFGLPTILLTGDTGSGKEFVFNNIFNRLNEMYRERFGVDQQLPLQKTNIAAYSGDLTYSELFGHKRGAFTGAYADRKGILEEAQGGVVFLDEIGDADPKTQVQLLRFLDNGGFVRLGDNTTRFARVLVVAATNKDLPDLIRKGAFREDLYFRLTELSIRIPCLNDRREDIPDLATHFLGQLYRIYRSPNEAEESVPTITASARELLTQHHYNGNIRELRSILQRALFLRSGRNIEADDIRQAIGTETPLVAPEPSDEPVEKLVQQTARLIFDRIVDGDQTFWSGVYLPFSENRIARDVVVQVVELARRQGSTSMPKIARLLKVCDPGNGNEHEQKTFFRFKNFLYKTIRMK